MENKNYVTTIVERLNRSFSRAKRDIKYKEWDSDNFIPNVLFESKEIDQTNVDEAIKAWAAENEVNLVEITEENSVLENLWEMATEGYLTADYLRTTENTFDMLNLPNTVLYFKRIDKMTNKLFRTRLMRFMNNQSVTFGDEKVHFAKNILFSVLTISDEMDKYERRELINDSKDGFVIIELENNMPYRSILQKEKDKFANLTSNLKLTGKTFDYDGFETAIRRAVLDLTARTLKPRTGVNGKLVERLIDRSNPTSFINQVKEYFNTSSKNLEEFDTWHKEMCDNVLGNIILHYTNGDGSDVCYGKAQKIVNITLKGCYCLEAASSKEEYFTHCHMALDSFTLSWYNRNHQKKIKTNWSNLSPDEYNTIVKNVRAINDPIFGDLTPLQKEFLIWPLEIMITTVKGINNCFGGLVDGDHVTEYFKTYDLSNDLMMANIILGLSKPEDLEEDFVKWLNKIPKSYNKSISAEFLLTQFGKNISND